MKTTDLIGTAVANTFRSKTRTVLTILSIFIGAFTLCLTSGLGTGINQYIDDTVSGVGASDAMTVTKTPEDSQELGPVSDGPAKYDPAAVSAGVPGMTVSALTPKDIETIEGIDGVLSVDPQRTISPDFIQFDDGEKYVVSVGSLIPGQTTALVEGVAPDDDATDSQVAVPESYLEPLGLGSAQDAIGDEVVIAITDGLREQHLIKAEVVGVTEEALASPTGSSVLTNQPLSDALFDAQTTGVPEAEANRFAQATLWFDDSSTTADVEALQTRLEDAGFAGLTIADRLGMVTSVIDGIVLVLNGFAVIALLAAAFGIVNTLFMSVQERTREIGLMKAMGMGSGRVFTLFSLEATFIGFLGSALGAVVAIAVGTAVSGALQGSLLSDLPGLNLIAFDPLSVAGIILLVMLIAFLAGTLPAARAASADPVESLRYE